MSFSGISATAYSALSASQLRTQLAASNIANADTEGYTRKSATQVAAVASGSAAGVTITAVTSAVNKYLLADIVGATSLAGAASTTADYAQSLQALLGSTSSGEGTGTSLAQLLADLETAASELTGSPTSATLKAQFVSALEAVATSLQSTAASVQGLRGDADQQIADGVDVVNAALSEIASLNDQIADAKARGQSTADLEDQRNVALQTVAEQMPVNYYVNSDGAMRVSTRSGVMLVGSSAQQLDYDPAALTTDDTVFASITVAGTAISIDGGQIGALLEQRDDTLPGVSDGLDALAMGLMDSLNTAYSALTGGDALLVGSGASTLAVNSDLLGQPSTLAVASAADATTLADAVAADWSFAETDLLGAMEGQFADYASALAGLIATESSSAEAQSENATSLLDSYKNAMASATGVNLDEETALLAELEQYYAVAAQILTTLNAMFDSLLSAASSA